MGFCCRKWIFTSYLLSFLSSLSVSIHSVDPKTCKLWCQKQFSPLSTSSTFFFHSSPPPPPFPRVPGFPGPSKDLTRKSVDSLEDRVNRIKNLPQITHPSVESRINKVGDRCPSPTYPWRQVQMTSAQCSDFFDPNPIHIFAHPPLLTLLISFAFGLHPSPPSPSSQFGHHMYVPSCTALPPLLWQQPLMRRRQRFT